MLLPTELINFLNDDDFIKIKKEEFEVLPNENDIKKYLY